LWAACSVSTFLRGDGDCSLVNLISNVTGTLPAANGGTGVTSLGSLTRVNDSNVTLTLGGTPTGALINNTSLTLGWTGLLPATRGGLGISTVTDDTMIIANGSGWVSSSLPDCLDTSGNHLNYNPTTNSIFCGTTSSVSPVTPANPTAVIGLTAVNGTSPNFIRSDGAPALSQAIAPTWTGTHTFNNSVTLNGGASSNGNITAARFLAGSGSAGSPGLSFSGENNTGFFRDGTTARINVSGNGSQIGYWDASRIYNAGDGIFEGRNFSAGGANSGATAVQLCHTGSGYGQIGVNVVCGAGSTESYGTNDVAGRIAFSNGSSRQWRFDSAVSGTGTITWVNQATLSSGGDLTISGSLNTSGTTSHIGPNNSTASNLYVGTTNGFISNSGRGLVAINGTTSSYLAFGNNGALSGYLGTDGSGNVELYNPSGPIVFYPSGTLKATIASNGGLFMAGATGGSQGSGTINATGLYVNGVAVGTGGSTTVFKASATDRSSTTTLASDPDLTFTSAASAVYKIDFCLVFGGVTTGTQGFKFAFNRTSSGTDPGQWGGSSRVNGSGTTHSGIFMGDGPGGTTGQVSFATISVGNQQDSVCGSGQLVTSGTSSYAIQWAQNSSSANATRLGQGSFLEYRRIN
jgi:hypothetical protein